jgi:hypothetical protein
MLEKSIVDGLVIVTRRLSQFWPAVHSIGPALAFGLSQMAAVSRSL